MTKAQEIDTLKQFTAGLPADSYLKPWLNGILPEVESEIRSDFPVSPSIAETRRQCSAMLAQAQAQAEDIKSRAQVAAAELDRKAREDRNMWQGRAAENMRQALKMIEA